jgi:hypothetical protein
MSNQILVGIRDFALLNSSLRSFLKKSSRYIGTPCFKSLASLELEHYISSNLLLGNSLKSFNGRMADAFSAVISVMIWKVNFRRVCGLRSTFRE